MSVGRINIDNNLTSISLGLNEEEIETNDLRCEDTVELEEIIEEVTKNIDAKN